MKSTQARRPHPAIREVSDRQRSTAGVRGANAKRGATDKAADTTKPAQPKRPRLKAGPGVSKMIAGAIAKIQAAPQAETPTAEDTRTTIKDSKTAKRVKQAKKMQQRKGSQQEVSTQKQLREKRLATEQIDDGRVQKVLAFSGIGSRREMEEIIEAGRVSVNGVIVQLGASVAPGDEVRIDGKRVPLKWPDRLPRIIIYHKQEGELVSRDDPEGRVTVFDRLKRVGSSKWVAIGRLDYNTSGLLLFTTSGELANRMMHPSFEVEREYAVRVHGHLSQEQMKELTRGITLEDGTAHFQRIEDRGGEGTNHWYHVTLREGRNREVRRMFEHFELTVSRLIRVRFGMFSLPGRLKRGQFYELTETEVLGAMKWADLTMAGAKKRR